MLLKNPTNLISGPLNKRKMDPWDSFFRFFFNYQISGSFKESLLTKVSTITILNKNIKEMGFLFIEALSLEILRARVARVLRTPNFWAGKWWELAWRYCSICVFFRNTWWERKPSIFLEIRISRKGRQPSTSYSMVNFEFLSHKLDMDHKSLNSTIISFVKEFRGLAQYYMQNKLKLGNSPDITCKTNLGNLDIWPFWCFWFGVPLLVKTMGFGLLIALAPEGLLLQCFTSK